ncbi:MAG: hypothetical protein Q7U05_00340 [Polaromonas sp.]|nr:hypothetical protein [Polaromonas sp.]
MPTLTEVVRPDPVATPLALPAEFANLLNAWPVGSNTSPSPVKEMLRDAPHDLTPDMLERILLRVELSLASRLPVSIDRVVEAQMQSFKAALRVQISATVLDAVKQAVMQETAALNPDSSQR